MPVPAPAAAPSRGRRHFLQLLAGQAVSQIGTFTTGFALGVWVLQRTDSVTLYAIVLFCTMLPQVLLAPMAGILTDRWDMRWTMLIVQLGGGACSVLLAVLFWCGWLDATWVFAMIIVRSSFRAFDLPSLSALTAALIPKEKLDRANGLVQMGLGLGQLVAPALGGLLFTAVALGWILVLDLVTFSVAIVTLLVTPVPPSAAADKAEGKGKFSLRDATARGAVSTASSSSCCSRRGCCS